MTYNCGERTHDVVADAVAAAVIEADVVVAAVD